MDGEYVRLGRTGLRVSRICVGAMSFGAPDRGADRWTLPEEASRALVRRALDLGLNFFDTANVYSDGDSEEILGRALRDLARRDEVVIATKVFGPMRSGPNGGGLSRKAIMTEIDNMQNHYNLLNREEEREMLPLCADQGVGVLVWSPLARGRLARDGAANTPRAADDAFGDSLYAGTVEADQRVLDRVGAVAAGLGTSRATVALAWLLGNPVVTAPIVGVTSAHHLDEAVAALDLDLPADAVADLERPYVPHAVAGFA